MSKCQKRHFSGRVLGMPLLANQTHDFYVGDQSTTWSAMRTCIPRAVMLRISASVERSAGENLVKRFFGEMPTASSSHDGVKGAVFPEFGARALCGF